MAIVMMVVMMVMPTVIVIMHTSLIVIHNADANTLAGNHRLDPGCVIFGTALERDQKAHAVKADAPVQISGMIAQLNRGSS